jgi:hypothetical protein
MFGTEISYFIVVKSRDSHALGIFKLLEMNQRRQINANTYGRYAAQRGNLRKLHSTSKYLK